MKKLTFAALTAIMTLSLGAAHAQDRQARSVDGPRNNATDNDRRTNAVTDRRGDNVRIESTQRRSATNQNRRSDVGQRGKTSVAIVINTNSKGKAGIRKNIKKANFRHKKANFGHGKILKRKIFHTKRHAQILLVEQVVRTKRGPKLVCTVGTQGRGAAYVPLKRIKRIAYNNCSPRAQIKYRA